MPGNEKVLSRPIVNEGVKALKAVGQTCYVRINGFATGLTFDDLEAVLCPEVDGIIFPKVETTEDMRTLDIFLTHLERRNSISVGTIDTTLNLETAKAMRNAYDIALSCSRIRTIILAAGPGGDANRAVGYVWSKKATETLYLRSKVVLDARAAEIQYPMISSWWDIKDLEGLEKDALLNRKLGFRGQVVMHPSHIAIVNKVFTPSVEEITYWKGLIKAVEKAEKKGEAAVVYEGDMVDYAMVKTGRELLALARTTGVDT